MDATSEIDVVLRVNRFRPKPERRHTRAGSPFAKRTSPSPFGANPSVRTRRGRHWTQEYTLAVAPTTTLLDCLLHIKRDIDPTLAFRYACGHGMCGSDAVSVNGVPTLLCTTTVSTISDQMRMRTPLASGRMSETDGFRHTGNPQSASVTSTPDDSRPDPMTIELSPLPGFPVERDLIVDIDPMIDQITRLKPVLRADGRLATTHDGKLDMLEYIQHPEELVRYELLSNCIACGVCEGSCPVFAGGDAFIGPAALVTASRFINDSRDQATASRLAAIDTEDGVAACQSVRACGRQCPRGIDVGEEMWQLITRVKQRHDDDTSRTTPDRHYGPFQRLE